jgi:hypothetical protein
MHIDIVEVVRQKQQKQLRGISIENGKVVVRPDILDSGEEKGRAKRMDEGELRARKTTYGR